MAPLYKKPELDEYRVVSIESQIQTLPYIDCPWFDRLRKNVHHHLVGWCLYRCQGQNHAFGKDKHVLPSKRYLLSTIGALMACNPIACLTYKTGIDNLTLP